MQRRGSGAMVGGLAAAGVLATHLLTFLVAAPDPHERAHLLASTGHVGTTGLAAVALGLAVAAAVRFLPLRRPALALVAVQTVGWLAVESVERLAHHDADWALSVVALGLIVQATLALVGAALLTAARHVVAAVRSRTRRQRRFGAAVPALRRLPVLASPLRPLALSGAATLRGPPSGS